MPLAAPLPPFNHSPLCSSVFTTLPSIRETLVFTCTDPTEKKKTVFSCICKETLQEINMPKRKVRITKIAKIL